VRLYALTVAFQVAIRASRGSITHLIMAVEIKLRGRNYGLQIGENHGSITPQFYFAPGRFRSLKLGDVDYLSPLQVDRQLYYSLINRGPLLTALLQERPETPPSPLSTVPFRRDPDFIDHGTLLDQIHQKSSAPASRVALVGLGGVGYAKDWAL
jgi:hypothetical protein